MTGSAGFSHIVERLKAEIPISRVIGEILALKREGRQMVGLCPFHPERSPSFMVNDAKRYFHCFGCGVHGDVFDFFNRALGLSLIEAVKRLSGESGPRDSTVLKSSTLPTAALTAAPAKATIELARAVWAAGAPWLGTAVERYLATRHGDLAAVLAPIKFHPQCPRGAERLPAMLALMSDPTTCQPCGVHRTYLQSDGSGKIGHGKTKMMLGPAGVIRLTPDGEVTAGLGLSEGIETGLAIMQTAGWRPVWACGSAGAIRAFPVLAGLESLTIFADVDDSGAGLKAARTCAVRWSEAGREARIQIPPDGTDWHDALGRGRDEP